MKSKHTTVIRKEKHCYKRSYTRSDASTHLRTSNLTPSHNTAIIQHYVTLSRIQSFSLVRKRLCHWKDENYMKGVRWNSHAKLGRPVEML
jgi:hypothetical protein